MGVNEHFYHGTVEHLKPGDTVLPAEKTGHKRNFSISNPQHAYATSDESNAWYYAERAWDASDKGHPRVYHVTPTGPTESDPAVDEQGRSRGNFESDVRSKHGFRVLSERQMPEHMGTPDEWR